MTTARIPWGANFVRRTAEALAAVVQAVGDHPGASRTALADLMHQDPATVSRWATLAVERGLLTERLTSRGRCLHPVLQNVRGGD